MDQLENSDELSPKSIAEKLGLLFVENFPNVTPPQTPNPADFTKIVGSWAKEKKIIPLSIEDNELVVATANPFDTLSIDALGLCYKLPVRVIVSTPEEITRAINSVRTSLMSDRTTDLGEEDGSAIESQLKIDVTDIEDADAPIIRYVNTLIFRAATERASDIHIEPFEDALRVRFRVDGVLIDVDSQPPQFQASILSRVKVMANLNIAEKRLPQDGRIGIRIAGQDVDIRVSTVPTRYGERIVLRLLDKSKVKLELETLGLSQKNILIIEKLIIRPYGIILVTGPTGSGKTTTLYAALSQINSEDKNILTIEDPVEYELRGIGQMQVNPKIDFTFASGLRSILRQDPDVIMVGEIRDLDTVEIAIQASLTGHLVFSTLHTNDASGAITRLLDMGVEPFLISSSLLAVFAQRLVRVLCPSCKISTAITATECQELGIPVRHYLGQEIFHPNPGGCPKCQKTGYRGRTGIHECILIDDNIRTQIMSRANASQIRQAAPDFLSLRGDGAEKILKGITSVEEVLRVTQEDADVAHID
jgi:general secretion pathway protein E